MAFLALSSILPSIWPGEKPARSSNISAFMITAGLGAGARPLLGGAGNWAALIACASNAGAVLALELDLDFAVVAADAISTTPAPTRTATSDLPRYLPIDEGLSPGSPRRPLRTRAVRFLVPATADPNASESFPMAGSCSRRRESADMENTLNR